MPPFIQNILALPAKTKAILEAAALEARAWIDTEYEKVFVDHVLAGCAHPVRKSQIHLECGTFNDFC